jgi:hypothetical protein
VLIAERSADAAEPQPIMVKPAVPALSQRPRSSLELHDSELEGADVRLEPGDEVGIDGSGRGVVPILELEEDAGREAPRRRAPPTP